MRAMREKISTIKFVGQENRTGPLDDSSDLRTRKKKHLTAAQRKLRELRSMEWHLKKDLERERRKIKEVLEQEKIEERLKEERKAKWRMKPVRLSYSIRS